MEDANEPVSPPEGVDGDKELLERYTDTRLQTKLSPEQLQAGEIS